MHLNGNDCHPPGQRLAAGTVAGIVNEIIGFTRDVTSAVVETARNTMMYCCCCRCYHSEAEDDREVGVVLSVSDPEESFSDVESISRDDVDSYEKHQKENATGNSIGVVGEEAPIDLVSDVNVVNPDVSRIMPSVEESAKCMDIALLVEAPTERTKNLKNGRGVLGWIGPKKAGFVKRIHRMRNIENE